MAKTVEERFEEKLGDLITDYKKMGASTDGIICALESQRDCLNEEG